MRFCNCEEFKKKYPDGIKDEKFCGFCGFTIRGEKKEIPQMLKKPNLRAVESMCAEYIQCLANGEYVDEDTKQYMLEETLKGFYGDDIFNYINSRI